MIRRPPRSTRTDTLFPYTTLFRSWGLTENGVKTTGRDRKVLPKIVIYDPDLTLTLPVEMSVASGLNAIAHAMEGLYAADGNPVVALMAEESIRALRSEERSVGKEGGSTCRSGWWPER